MVRCMVFDAKFIVLYMQQYFSAKKIYAAIFVSIQLIYKLLLLSLQRWQLLNILVVSTSINSQKSQKAKSLNERFTFEVDE